MRDPSRSPAGALGSATRRSWTPRGGKTKIVKKHETPTRVGGVLGGGVGLAAA